MRKCLILLAFLALSPGLRAQEPPRFNAADATNLAFLGAKQPVLIRLNVLIDGKPIQAYFNDYIEKWYRYLDVDNDGLLNADELARAPSDQAWAQMIRQGAFFPNRGGGLNLAQFGRKADEKVTLPELQAHYARLNGPISVVAQANNAATFSAASNSLFKALDLNNDGKLSKDELLAAAKSLRKLDLDDDEIITTQELAGNVGNNPFGNIAFRQPGMVGPGNPQIGDAFFHIRPGENRLPLLLLSLYDREKAQKLSRAQLGLDEATFAKLDMDNDGRLDLAELARWHERPADLEFTIRLGASAGLEMRKPAKSFAGAVKESSPGVYQLNLEDSQISLLQPQGRAGTMVRFNPAQNYLQIFRMADTKGQGFVEMQDIAAPQFQFLRMLFPVLDRDRDGKLTEKEVREYAELQGGATDCAVTVSLADQGRALFQMLDTNRDGRLSHRELLNAWARLAPLDRNKTGSISTADLTRQFQISVQRGIGNGGNFVIPVNAFGMNPTAAVPQPAYPKDAPAWFRKMDRNGDGDVSPAEFLGSRAEFDRIDTDGDGLISAEEAIRYDALMRARK